MPIVGTGTTIAFGTSSFTAEVMNLNGPGISRPPIDTTHMGTTNYRTFIPGSLVDGGTIDFEFSFDPDDQPPIAGVSETITITFPSSLANGATLVFTGFVTDWEWTDPLEDKMTATATIKVDGQTDPVWTDASA